MFCRSASFSTNRYQIQFCAESSNPASFRLIPHVPGCIKSFSSSHVCHCNMPRGLPGTLSRPAWITPGVSPVTEARWCARKTRANGRIFFSPPTGRILRRSKPSQAKIITSRSPIRTTTHSNSSPTPTCFSMKLRPCRHCRLMTGQVEDRPATDGCWPRESDIYLVWAASRRWVNVA